MATPLKCNFLFNKLLLALAKLMEPFSSSPTQLRPSPRSVSPVLVLILMIAESILHSSMIINETKHMFKVVHVTLLNQNNHPMSALGLGVHSAFFC